MNRCISRSAILKAGILALMVALVIFGAFAALSVKADAAEAATEYTNTQGLTSTFLLYNADTKGDPISGHDTLNAALEGAKASGLAGNYYISMTADGTNTVKTNMYSPTFFTGKVIIDLGGNTLTYSARIFDYSAGLGAPANYSDITFKNGTIKRTANDVIFCMNYYAYLKSDATVTAMFDGITFIAETSTDNKYFLFNTWEDAFYKGAKANVIVNVDFNECTFDMDNSFEGVKMLPMFSSDGGRVERDRTIFNVTVNGGKLLADNVNDFTNFALMNDGRNDRADTLTLGKNSNGEYMKVYSLTEAAITVPETLWNTTAGNGMKYIAAEADADYSAYSVYELDEANAVAPVSTDYGVIPPEYASVSSYPVALFTPGKSFLGAYATLQEAFRAAGTMDKTRDYCILLRDTILSTSTLADGEIIRKFSGHITVDLGGNNSLRYNATLLDFYVADNSANAPLDKRMNLTFKNGTIERAAAKTFICVNYASTLATDVKHVFDFENIKFVSPESGEGFFIYNTWEDGSKNGNLANMNPQFIVESTFTNCVFDMANSADGLTMLPMISSEGSRKTFDINIYNVKINGGKILVNSLDDFEKFAPMNDASRARPDTLVFGKNASEEYTSLYVYGDLAISGEELTYINSEGALMKYNYTGDDEGYKVYTFTEIASPVSTEYGLIPGVYASANDYPIALFYADKTFVGAYKDFSDVMYAIQGRVYSDFVILLRADVNDSVASGGEGLIYGNILIDLNTFTLTNTSGYIIDIYFNNNAAGDTTEERATFTFKNGTIVDQDYSIVCVNYGTLNRSQKFTINFDNVTFRGDEGLQNFESVVFATWDDGYTDTMTTNIYVDSTFTNCKFDLLNSTYDKAYMFMLTNSGRKGLDFNVTLKGCTIISDNMVPFEKLYSNENNEVMKDGDDTFVVAKDDNGKYIDMILPEGGSAYSDKWITLEGTDMSLVKTGVSEGFVTYGLIPTSSVQNFTPKANITLDSNLIFNIYLPTTKTVEALVLNGEDREIKEEDGYYVISEPLNSFEAAKTLTLEVTIDVDGTKLKGTFTFSTLAYAESVYASTTNENEITLVSDVLAYIKSAYTYFEKTDEAAMAKIDELLLAHPASAFPETVYPVNTISGSFADVKAITFVLKDTPALKLYLNNDIEANTLTYSIGGRELTYTTGEDTTGDYVGYTYVIITGYAHLMTDTITVSRKTPVEGEVNSGEINLEAYYYLASNGGTVSAENSTLVDIVEKFYNYCTSAKAYRNSVMNPDANA
ncbi:MAG: hypothetical protein IJY18_02990, partial [Clostridia bacterium]|nr:hypothetical protein [Clostridia bacterium]